MDFGFGGEAGDAALGQHMAQPGKASYEDGPCGKGPVWIRVILAPEQARECGDVLRLRSEDGGYDREKPISGFDECGKNTVDLLFEDAPMDRAFSLDVIDAQGKAHIMFSGIPYGDLRKAANRD